MGRQDARTDAALYYVVSVNQSGRASHDSRVSVTRTFSTRYPGLPLAEKGGVRPDRRSGALPLARYCSYMGSYQCGLQASLPASVRELGVESEESRQTDRQTARPQQEHHHYKQLEGKYHGRAASLPLAEKGGG